jgi:hypothetical protein
MPRPTNEQADRAFESNLRRQESILERQLNQNFNQLSKDIQRLMESFDIAGAESAVSLNDIVLQQILLDAYERGNRQGSRMAARDLEEDESLVEEAALLALLLWRSSTADRVSKEINRTTRKVFDKILDRTRSDLTIRDAAGQILSSPTNEELSKEVAKRTKAENKRRSGTIATTESQRGTQEGANQAGIEVQQKVQKTWRSQGDRRVRPTHRAANGQTVAMDEVFSVGRGKGRFPTDSMLPSEEAVGCRCYLRLKKVPL